MPTAILFDLGDTVLKENAYSISHGFEVISKYLSSDVTFDRFSQAVRSSQVGTDEFKLSQWLVDNLSADQDSSNIEAIELELWIETVSLSPIRDVGRALEFLHRENIRIAAISNAIFSSHCMRYELQKHGLASYFEFVLSSGDLGIKKPDPKIFKLALAKLGLTPGEVWYIGDKWDADVIGANSVEMLPIWFKRDFPDHDASIKHLKLSQWSDFEKVWGRRNDAQ